MEGNETNTQLPDFSQMLSKVMANPQAAAMFSSLLGSTAPKEKCEDRDEEKGEREHKDDEQKILPPKGGQCSTRERRKRLLLALKPYLSPERCQAIDRILMITEALSLLQSEKRP